MSSDERWEVRQLDLEEPLQDMAVSPKARGIYCQIWWRTLPLGHIWLQQELLPVRASRLRQLAARAIAPAVGAHLTGSGFRAALPTIAANPARDNSPSLRSLIELCLPLSGLEKCLPDCTGAPRSVSVIICTRSRANHLRKCLSSLAVCDNPPSEIIVVDNAPQTPETRRVVEEFPSMTYIAEPKPGLSRARNAGLRHATGEIIAWTDDDTVVHPHWIRAIRQVFSDSSVSGMTGLVLPLELETASQVRFEREFGGFNRGYRKLDFDRQFFEEMRDLGVPVWRIGAGANMAFRRTVFDAVGTFDERLGAGASGCSEDSELWYRMLAAHMGIRYEPRAVVLHSHRIDEDQFRKQMEQYMKGHVASLLVQFEKCRDFGNLRRLLLSLPKHYLRLATGREAGAARGTIRHEVLACLRGVLFYLNSRVG